MTHSVVFIAVGFGHAVASFAQVLFEGDIDNKFLPYRMTSKLPSELVAEALLIVMVGRIDHLIVILQLAVVLDNGLRKGSHGGKASMVQWSLDEAEVRPLYPRRN